MNKTTKTCKRCYKELDINKFYSCTPDQSKTSDICFNCFKSAKENTEKIKKIRTLNLDFIITHGVPGNPGYILYMKDIMGHEYDINIAFIITREGSHRSKVNFMHYIDQLKNIGLDPSKVYTKIMYKNDNGSVEIDFKFVSIVNYNYTKQYVKNNINKIVQELNISLTDILNIINEMEQ